MSRPRAVWRPAPWLAAGLAAGFLAGGLPLAWLGAVVVRDIPSLQSALLSPQAGRLLADTVLLAGLVSVLAGTVGTLLGILLAKTDLPCATALAAVLTFPLFLPPYVVALGWFTVLGRQGLFAAALGAGAGVRASGFFFGLGGAVLVLVTAYTPIVIHLVRIALRSIDPALEESARLRFRWLRVARRIDLPLIAPAVVLGMLVTFILVGGEFGVPAYLRYPVFSTEVFTQFAAFLNVRGAVAMSIPLAILVVAGLGVERYVLRHRVRFLGQARRINRLRIPLGRPRVLVAAAAWGYGLLTVLVPLAGLMTHAGGGASYSAALRGAGASILRSLWMAAVAATLMLILGVLLAYLVERGGRRRHDTLDSLFLLLFAAPGTVLGVGLILLWNRAGLTWLYGSAAIVLIGYVGHFTPLAVRAIGIGLRSVSPGVEEAARLAGIPWGRALRRVLLPLLRPALAAAWFLAFVFCLRDLDLAVTIYPPGAETLPIRVYTLMANSPEPVTAALALVIAGLTAVLLAAGWGGRAAFHAWRGSGD